MARLGGARGRAATGPSAERIVRLWPRATLVATTGLGHRRVLRDPSVIDRVVAFAAGRV
jgi:hypothetical protein